MKQLLGFWRTLICFSEVIILGFTKSFVLSGFFYCSILSLSGSGSGSLIGGVGGGGGSMFGSLEGTSRMTIIVKRI